MRIEIPYGTEKLELRLPENQVVGVCDPLPMEPASDPDTLLRQSIEAGFEERDLSSKATLGARACIAITDRTRSTPNAHIVPILLDQLNALDTPDWRITVISGGCRSEKNIHRGAASFFRRLFVNGNENIAAPSTEQHMESPRRDIYMVILGNNIVSAFGHVIRTFDVQAIGKGLGKCGRHMLDNKYGHMDLFTKRGQHLCKGLWSSCGDPDKYGFDF